MSRLIATLLAGAAALSGAAFAQPAVEASAQMERQVISGAQAVTDSYAFQDFKGQYELDNGKVLTVSGGPHRYLAQLEGQPGVTELVAAGGAAFVARDGSLRLDFTQRRNGNVTGVTVTEARALR